RIRPYKNVENRIDGAVLALFDIQSAKEAEQHLRHAQSYTEAVIETAHEPLVVIDERLRITATNQAFRTAFGIGDRGVVGVALTEAGPARWDGDRVRDLCARALRADGGVRAFTIEHELPRHGRARLLVNARRIESADGADTQLLLAFGGAGLPG